MYMEVLRSIDGISIFPVVSLLVFVTVFTIMLLWAMRLTSSALRQYADMPLDAEPPAHREGDGRDRQEA
jgi:hypothetical protein